MASTIIRASLPKSADRRLMAGYNVVCERAAKGYSGNMTVKNIVIAALLFIGFHLILYGYIRRYIAAAKRGGKK